MNTKLLTELLQISQQMSMTHDFTELITLALQKTLDIVPAERCYLVLGGADGVLDYHARLLKEGLDNDPEHDVLSRSIYNEVLRTGKPVVITDAQSDERYATSTSIRELSVRSVMCAPLAVSGKVIGAIYVENRSFEGAFHEEDIEPLIFFANHAAVAIENSRIINTLEERVAERTRELESRWNEAVESNKMRTLLLGQLVHDMRTPLSIIGLSISSILSPVYGPLTERQGRTLNRGMEGVRQLTALVDNMFDISKLDMNVLTLNQETVDLTDFLERMYQMGLSLPWQENVSFEQKLEIKNVYVLIDPVRIQQVVMNLLSNALKFTQSGQVVLHAAIHDTEVHIGVTDTGAGIPLEEQKYVFERFHQISENNPYKASGAGLGLAICHDLVEKHGGRIWVNSAPGEGSDFVFSLPTGTNTG